jgi:hypothetical protein
MEFCSPTAPNFFPKREPGPVSEEKPELNRGSVQPGTIGVHDRMTKTESLLAAQCSRPQQPSCATRPGVGVHASSRFWFSVAHTRKPDHGRPATKAGSGLRPTALVSFIPADDKGKPTAAVSFITNFILKSTNCSGILYHELHFEVDARSL